MPKILRCGKIWIKRRKGVIVTKYRTAKAKFRGSGVDLSFWASVSENGFGRLVFYSGKIVNEKHLEIYIII